MQFANSFLQVLLLLVFMFKQTISKAFLKTTIEPIDSSITYLSTFKNGIPVRTIEFKDFLVSAKLNASKQRLEQDFGKNLINLENPITFDIETYRLDSLDYYSPPRYKFEENKSNNLVELEFVCYNIDEDDKTLIMSLFFEKGNSSSPKAHKLIQSTSQLLNRFKPEVNFDDNSLFELISSKPFRYGKQDAKNSWVGNIIPIQIDSSSLDMIANYLISSQKRKIDIQTFFSSTNSTLFLLNSPETPENEISENKSEIENKMNLVFQHSNYPSSSLNHMNFPRFLQRNKEEGQNERSYEKKIELLSRKCRIFQEGKAKNISKERTEEWKKFCAQILKPIGVNKKLNRRQDPSEPEDFPTTIPNDTTLQNVSNQTNNSTPPPPPDGNVMDFDPFDEGNSNKTNQTQNQSQNSNSTNAGGQSQNNNSSNVTQGNNNTNATQATNNTNVTNGNSSTSSVIPHATLLPNSTSDVNKTNSTQPNIYNQTFINNSNTYYNHNPNCSAQNSNNNQTLIPGSTNYPFANTINNQSGSNSSSTNVNLNITAPKIYKNDKVTISQGTYTLDSVLIIGGN